jgi:hypothetical protein
MGLQQSRIARKHVNVMDNVRDARPVPVPAFTVIARVDSPNVDSFTREKTRETGAFWAEFNDLHVRDLTWLGKGECE